MLVLVATSVPFNQTLISPDLNFKATLLLSVITAAVAIDGTPVIKALSVLVVSKNKFTLFAVVPSLKDIILVVPSLLKALPSKYSVPSVEFILAKLPPLVHTSWLRVTVEPDVGM